MPLLGTRGAASAQGFGEFAAPSGPATYVENVFSTYLYKGNGTATQPIPNGLQLGGLPANGTVLQLTGDALTDSAPVPCGITNSGVTVSTSVKKYGTGSYLYNGTTTNKLIATSPDLAVGTGDFTVECWVYASAIGNQGVFQFGNDFGSGCVFVSMYPDNQFQWGWDSSYTGGVGSWPTSTWVYVTLVRQSGVMKFYVNGTQVGSNNTYAGSINFGRCWVGDYYTGGYALNGYIDDFRITNKALYTSNFTPPSQALPLDTLVAGSNYGGLVWVKSRTSASNNWLIDTNRGILKGISSEITAAEVSYPNSVNGFASTGFSLGSNGDWNSASNNYVSWTFRKQPKFFDVVTASVAAYPTLTTINHNLGSTPGCIMMKQTNASSDWVVWHTSVGNNNLVLNSTGAAGSAYAGYVLNVNSTSFQVYAPGTAGTYVFYIFAHNAGGFGTAGTDNVISCGSFTTDGSGNATVNLGYEPQYVMWKAASGSYPTGNWWIADNMRGFSQTGMNTLYANTSGAQNVFTTKYVCPTATGFELVNSFENPTTTYIYIAIRRGPMKTPTSGTSVFSPTTRTGTNSAATVTGVGFAPDLFLTSDRNAAAHGGISGSVGVFVDKLRGGNNYLISQNTGAEGSGVNISFQNTGISYGGSDLNTSPYDYANWFFVRAPSFMDEVCYTGTSATQTINHNLGVVPELIILKRRSSSSSWPVWRTATGTGTSFIYLNDASGDADQGVNILTATPTTTAMSLSSWGGINGSGSTYVAYLFASCPGVSKVGSYTGTGGTQTISCGFAARWVMIKRTDSTGNWWVWDTARGMVAGTDPRLAMNSSAAEVNANWVYTDASGFQIVTTDATVNASGGTYIYLAIA